MMPEVEVPFAESGSFSQQRREAGLKAKASQAVSAAEASVGCSAGFG